MGGGDSYAIGPGIWGFLAFFVMAIALWLLVRNMSGRLRRMAYQERDGIPLGQEHAEAGDDTFSSAAADVEGAPNTVGQPESKATDRPNEGDDGDDDDEDDDADGPDDPSLDPRR